MSTEQDPTVPDIQGRDLVPDQLKLDIEQTLVGVIALPDENLFEVGEALHCFVDAFCTREHHDAFMEGLYAALVDARKEPAVTLRAWAEDALAAVRGRLTEIGLDGSGLWCYHQKMGGYIYWALTHDSFGPASFTG